MSYPSFQNTGESDFGEINYPTVMDEIDQWLADNFGIMPGACSSIESVKYSVAKRVAKALWPKKNSKPKVFHCSDCIHLKMGRRTLQNQWYDSPYCEMKPKIIAGKSGYFYATLPGKKACEMLSKS